VRTALAWNSIVDDVEAGRLNIDRLQENQAKQELKSAEDVLPRVARECFKWLLCPEQSDPKADKLSLEPYPLNVSSSSFDEEISRICTENELIISKWSPIHLREELRKYYWKNDKAAVRAVDFWEDTLRYVYLPRLRSKSVLEQAIITGAGSRDFFGTAYGMAGGAYEGFKFGDVNVQLDDTLLLISPDGAGKYESAVARETPSQTYDTAAAAQSIAPEAAAPESPANPSNEFFMVSPAVPIKSREFYGSVEVATATAKVRLTELADEIISVLAQDPHANLTITLEIKAEFPDGAPDNIRRAVSENAANLKFKNSTWE
jgi:hypothetical protein